MIILPSSNEWKLINFPQNWLNMLCIQGARTLGEFKDSKSHVKVGRIGSGQQQVGSFWL